MCGNGDEYSLANVIDKRVGLLFEMLLVENGVDPRSVDFNQDRDGVMLGDLFQGDMGDYFVTEGLSTLAIVAKNPNFQSRWRW